MTVEMPDGDLPPIAIVAESADQPEVHALLRQSDAYHAALYPAESNHLVDVAVLAAPNVRFVVARRGGKRDRLRRAGDGRGRRGRAQAHVRRARGARPKLGSRILDALEAAARAEGVRVIRLETGVRQPEVARPSTAATATPSAARSAPTSRDPLSTFFEKWIG